MKINRKFGDGEMVKYISGKQFKDSGMLWLVNTFLHAFGMSIILDIPTGELKAAVVKFRGYGVSINDGGYKKVTQYMIDNAEELIKDCE